MNADEIKTLAGKYGVFPDTIQKDYAITILLGIISEFNKVSSLTFKGGTALKKIYYPEARFSVDLDFTCSEDVSVELSDTIREKIQGKLDVNFTEVKKLDAGKNSTKYSVKYLNYNSHPDSVKIDLSLREKVVNEIKNQKIIHSYNLKNGDFTIPTMTITEIMAEKIRALIHTEKPRHLYDMWYLFGKDVSLDHNLVISKLRFYNEEFNLEQLKNGISKMETDWENDLNPLLQAVPLFEGVSKKVIENIAKAMR